MHPDELQEPVHPMHLVVGSLAWRVVSDAIPYFDGWSSAIRRVYRSGVAAPSATG